MCVTLTGEIGTSITLQLTTSNDTATCNVPHNSRCTYIVQVKCFFLTAGEDYTHIDEELVILPGQQESEHCMMVNILNDTILENNETFTISLKSDEIGVNITLSEATVSIIDNDGLYTCLL